MIPNFNNNGPCFELFSSASDIIKYWKQKGKISKEFEPHTKSYIYYLQFGGVSVLSIPINEKHSLQINNSNLLFQFMLYNTKSFSIEIGIKDKGDTKRRFNITTSVKDVDQKNLYVKIPLNDYPLNIWTNLIIDLEDLIQQYFKTQTYKVIDNIHISGCLKIRKVISIKSNDEPIFKSVDMGKSIPIVNLLLLNSGNVVKKDLKIIGINNLYINNVNINSNSLQNQLNSPPRYNKREKSPSTNIINKFSTTSDINLNKHRNYYRKNNEHNNSNIKIYENNYNNSNNDLSDGLNITPVSNINRAQMENLSKKTKDNLINAKKFVKELHNKTNVGNDIKYAVIKNIKNNNISSFEENENANNSNKMLNINNKEKGKSLGKYVYKHQQNKKRNKSNNPYNAQKLNKKIIKEENNDIFKINENKNSSSKKIIKEENNSNNSNKNNLYINKDKKSSKNNITPVKSNEKENKEKSSNNNTYYSKKEQEISLNNYTENINQNKDIKNPENENKSKYSNISLPNTLKESKHIGNENKQNKYSNYDNMLLESGFDIKNIPIYDSIEEIAEWPADLNNNVNNGIADEAEKMGDKLIQLESGNNNNQKNNEENNEIIDGDDFLEISSLFKKKETMRPYTPPIEELVQVNPNKLKGESNMKCSMDKKSNLMTTNRILKNYENLIYNQDKGLFYDPKTNIYYDIKTK